MYNTNKTDCLDLVALMKEWKEAGMTKNLWYRDIQQEFSYTYPMVSQLRRKFAREFNFLIFLVKKINNRLSKRNFFIVFLQ